ncbi:hypothetical protein MP228_010495 [Amoeboaphelidium protococcarum]|nr:hypothetical protein MP228_010495 [Amoeboaphelidium protococcarum]
MSQKNENQLLSEVKEYYGKTLKTTKDLQTSACTAACTPLPYSVHHALKNVPDKIIEKFYGCGTPIPLGIEGLTVLDLGSGSGRDCYVLSQLVGAEGKVIGLDMTEEQLEVARQCMPEFEAKIGFKNMEFRHGYIESLTQHGIAEESVDLIVSNCVVNLSPRKDLVLQEVWKVLKYGGELYFSDVYADRRVSEQARNDEILWGECISGALYYNDFLDMAKSVGFKDVRRVSISEIAIENKFKKITGNTKFYSITYRLFKLREMDNRCEDYGQIGKYMGTVDGQPLGYQLDEDHYFETGKWVSVCGNTAAMLSESWLGKYFTIMGDKSIHYGVFPDCGSSSATFNQKPLLKLGGCC